MSAVPLFFLQNILCSVPERQEKLELLTSYKPLCPVSLLSQLFRTRLYGASYKVKTEDNEGQSEEESRTQIFVTQIPLALVPWGTWELPVGSRAPVP